MNKGETQDVQTERLITTPALNSNTCIGLYIYSRVTEGMKGERKNH